MIIGALLLKRHRPLDSSPCGPIMSATFPGIGACILREYDPVQCLHAASPFLPHGLLASTSVPRHAHKLSLRQINTGPPIFGGRISRLCCDALAWPLGREVALERGSASRGSSMGTPGRCRLDGGTALHQATEAAANSRSAIAISGACRSNTMSLCVRRQCVTMRLPEGSLRAGIGCDQYTPNDDVASLIKSPT